MRKEELWDIYTRKNPQFLVGPVTFTAKGLRDLFDMTWEQGHKQGLANGRVLGKDESSATTKKKSDPFDGIFEGKNNPFDSMFGPKP